MTLHTPARQLLEKCYQREPNAVINKQFFFFSMVAYHLASGKVRSFVDFENFKTIFQRKSNPRLYANTAWAKLKFY